MTNHGNQLRWSPLLILSLILGSPERLLSEVPHLITYQGQVAVNGRPFTGTGEFKFALTDDSGGKYYWSNDGRSVSGEPASAVRLEVREGIFSVMLGQDRIPGMAPVPAGLFQDYPVRYLRTWFNDGINGFEQLRPDHQLSSVPYALQAGSVPARSITQRELANGSVSAGKLAGGAVLANLKASGVNGIGNGGIVLSAEAQSDALTSAGYVKIGRSDLIEEEWDDILEDAIIPGLTPLAQSGATAVWTGEELLVWGGTTQNGVVASRGAIYHPATDTWRPMSPSGITGRIGHTAVWTGTEMIVFGGSPSQSPGAYASGARYNPATDTWTLLNRTGGPQPRAFHSAVWTGSEMIIWGGLDYTYVQANATVPFNRTDGFRYDPSTDTWQSMAPNTLIQPRAGHSAVWTGTDMIVWGGLTAALGQRQTDGARYHPATDSWTTIQSASSPSGRLGQQAVWTGTEMIIWGGDDVQGQPVNTGGRYRPASDSWRPAGLSLQNAPAPRRGFSAVWTGTHMVVWGGFDGNRDRLQTGGLYDPVRNQWAATPTAGAPRPRDGHVAVWTGSEMVIWGGSAFRHEDSGGRYNPASDAWKPTPPSGALSPRQYHTAVWTGTDMIIWGGQTDGIHLRTGVRYHPESRTWQAISTVGAPTARSGHTAVWTGTEMIIWGGYGEGAPFGEGFLGTGARYNKVTDTWSPLTDVDAPSSRNNHQAIWTGSEMVIWGGFNGAYLDSGARYQPATDTWRATSTLGAPQGRSFHSCAWTGTEMVVWGGRGGSFQFTWSMADGARYNPWTDRWMPMTSAGAPSARDLHSTVWTGDRMIVWGGLNGTNVLNTGAIYHPTGDTWVSLSVSNVFGGAFPHMPALARHQAVWDGTHMILGGGLRDAEGDSLNGWGYRYHPGTGEWTQLRPSYYVRERILHTTIWTGAAMLIHGGYGRVGLGESAMKDSIAYTPGRTLYFYMNP